MRILTALLIGLLASTPALAADKAKGKDGKDAKDPTDGQYVNLSPVAVPIVLKGQLINYIFVTLRLNVAPFADAGKLRDREPYFRDAFVRAAHRTPFVKPGDYSHVNEAALKTTMMAESARIAGPNVVTSVQIMAAQAQRLTGLPRDDAPAAPRTPIP